jgi:hypothetical protein
MPGNRLKAENLGRDISKKKICHQRILIHSA